MDAPCTLRPLSAPVDFLSLHRYNRARYPFMLESVARGTAQSRYDILFAFPEDSLALADTRDEDFLSRLDERWKRERTAHRDCAPALPFRGGWFVYLGYELAGQVEPRLRLPAVYSDFPIAFAVRIPAAVVTDHHTGISWIVAERGREELLDVIAADVDRCSFATVATDLRIAALEEDDPQRYLRGVERALEYIRAGDVFQVNLSRAWRASLAAGDYAEVYRRLRMRNPAPFAGLATWSDMAVLSSSPERLVRKRGERVDTRPIAGTRARSASISEDAEMSHTLMAHPKERAEHVMLVDLERNDLGRVCLPGTVEVDELMVLESYAHVHHIVSNVCGRVRVDTTPGQIMRAVFPGGTITGCPKVRCMEIIAELEETGRGPYTGAMGYLNRDGDFDLNILIRTIWCERGKLGLRAGAGIVADSVPERELEETRAKAKGMLLALQDAP